MPETPKLWVGLGAALLTSTSLATAALLGDAQAARAQPAPALQGAALEGAAPQDALPRSGEVSWHGLQLAAGEGGDSAASMDAGEGGEQGEAGMAPDLARSDPAYLTQLGLMRGHLNVGFELYQRGDSVPAAAHMKHAEVELYGALEPALKQRGAPELEEELERLADRVEDHAGPAAVKAAYDAALAVIAKAEGVVAHPSPHQIGEVIYNLAAHAADDYGKAVEDGQVTEADEYQDALGFLRIAEHWLDRLAAAGADQTSVAAIRAQIEVVKPAWPSVIPPHKATTDPSVIYGAAARIQIASLHLKK